MKSNLSYVACVAFLLGCTNSQRTEYPPAERIVVSEVKFGKTIEDPYRWLEEMTTPRVNKWVSSQDQLMKSYLHNEKRQGIEKRIAELKLYSSYTPPVKVNDIHFYVKTEANKSRGTLFQQIGEQGEALPILNPDEIFSDSTTQIHTVSGGNSLGYDPSPDGKKMLISLSDGRSRWFTLHLYDLSTMQESQTDVLTGLHNLSSSVKWARDNSGFFYVRFEAPKDSESLLKAIAVNPAIYFHRIGTSQAEDSKVFEKNEAGHSWTFGIDLTADGQFLVIDARDGTKAENMIYLKELKPKGKLVELLIRQDAGYTFLGSHDSELFFYTNLKAPRGRIIGMNVQKKLVYEIVSQAPETVSGGSLVGGNALGFFGNKFVITYIKDGVPLLRGFDINGRQLYTTTLPIDGSIWGGFVGTSANDDVFFNFLGFTSPSSIYKIDATTGKLSLFKRSDVNFDPDMYITKKVFYSSKDGTRVPMFITHRKDIKLDGRNPALMYAYGAAGWISFLWFQEHLLAWLEMGGIYAQPSIRGGGEYGEEWHAAGVRHNRQNAVDDFHAASEYLIENKYTSASLLAANGGSLSSALVGAAVMQRPELYGAMILDRPVLDMLRYTKFTNGSSWIDDLGNPDIEADFKTLYSLSPYHLVTPDKCFPPTLVMVGDKDQVTPPSHAYKFVAAMQQNQNCDNIVLLKMMWGAGHSFGTTPAETIDSRSDEIAFLMKVFRLGYPW